jgi:ABC-type multidrug transport system ATPase subunit
MIINRGKNVIVGTPTELRDKISGAPTVEISLKKLTSEVVEAAKKVSHVKQVAAEASTSKLTIILDDPQMGTPEVVKKVVEAGGSIFGVRVVRPSLEEAYLKLIKEEQK